MSGMLVAAVLAVSAPAPAVRCARLSSPLAAGDAPTLGQLRSADCGPAPAHVFRYDARLRALRATRNLNAGELVASPPDALVPAVAPGERMRLLVRFGAVSLERQVTAVQPGRAGGSVFVRTDDGAVFAAPVQALER